MFGQFEQKSPRGAVRAMSLKEIANICSPRHLKRMFNRLFSSVKRAFGTLHSPCNRAWSAIIILFIKPFFLAAFYEDKSYRTSSNGIRTKADSTACYYVSECESSRNMFQYVSECRFRARLYVLTINRSRRK